MLLTKEETFESALFYFNLVIRDVFVESSKYYSATIKQVAKVAFCNFSFI